MFWRYVHIKIVVSFYRMFKSQFSLEDRRAEAARVRARYPDRIPVIVEVSPKADLPQLDKKKFLTPGDLTVGQFAHTIRKKMNLDSHKAMFLLIGNRLAATASLIGTLHETDHDVDGFLYITVH